MFTEVSTNYRLSWNKQVEEYELESDRDLAV